MKDFMWPSGPWLLWLLSAMLSGLEACPVECNCRRQNTLVDCAGRGLTEVPHGIPRNVIHLFLQNNSIASLTHHSGLRRLVNLSRLNLNDNKLRHISSGSFPASLILLALDNNSLTVITTGMFSHTIIMRMGMAYNQIKRIEDNAFPPTLESLDLHHNKMRVVNRTAFSSYKKLLVLCLTHNNIHKIEKMAFPSSLQMLRLGFNRLKKIGQEFSNLHALKTLFLYYNTIEKIRKDSFTELVALQELNLMKNRLTVVHPGQFAKQVSLTTLNLYDNLIHTLPESAFPLKHALERLYLQGNPLHCNCEMRWVARMINSSGLNTRMYERFFEDQELKGQVWPLLPGKDTIFCNTPTLFSAKPIMWINFDFCLEDSPTVKEPNTPWPFHIDEHIDEDTAPSPIDRTSPVRAKKEPPSSSPANSLTPVFSGMVLSLVVVLLP